MHRSALAWLGGLLVLAGCQPDLAECATATQADNVVFLADGTPMFAGQALVHVSCAAGTCHASGADDSGRNGAPAGLNFNVDPACGFEVEDCDTVPDAFERLDRSARKVRSFDHEILRTLQDDSMPPAGAPVPVDVFGTFEGGVLSNPLPAITTPEGREIVSEWLGCGSRVIEVAREATDPTREAPGQRCDDAVGGRFCAYAAPVGPPDPQWAGETGIYQRAIVNLGCLSCHRDDGNPNWGPDDQELDLCLSSPDPATGDCDPEAVRASLVGQMAVGYDCSGGIDPGMHIVAGDPANSFFLEKVRPDPDCGGAMPDGSDDGIPSDFSDVIEQWIRDGAMP